MGAHLFAFFESTCLIGYQSMDQLADVISAVATLCPQVLSPKSLAAAACVCRTAAIATDKISGSAEYWRHYVISKCRCVTCVFKVGRREKHCRKTNPQLQGVSATDLKAFYHRKTRPRQMTAGAAMLTASLGLRHYRPLGIMEGAITRDDVAVCKQMFAEVLVSRETMEFAIKAEAAECVRFMFPRIQECRQYDVLTTVCKRPKILDALLTDKLVDPLYCLEECVRMEVVAAVKTITAAATPTTKLATLTSEAISTIISADLDFDDLLAEAVSSCDPNIESIKILATAAGSRQRGFSMAAVRGLVEVVRLLLEFPVEITEEIVTDAAAGGHFEVVKMLIADPRTSFAAAAPAIKKAVQVAADLSKQIATRDFAALAAGYLLDEWMVSLRNTCGSQVADEISRRIAGNPRA